MACLSSARANDGVVGARSSRVGWACDRVMNSPGRSPPVPRTKTMTGLDLESFLLLLRADLSALGGLGACDHRVSPPGLALLGLATRLRKCLVLSLSAHLGVGPFREHRPFDPVGRERRAVRVLGSIAHPTDPGFPAGRIGATLGGSDIEGSRRGHDALRRRFAVHISAGACGGTPPAGRYRLECASAGVCGSRGPRSPDQPPCSDAYRDRDASAVAAGSGTARDRLRRHESVGCGGWTGATVSASSQPGRSGP